MRSHRPVPAVTGYSGPARPAVLQPAQETAKQLPAVKPGVLQPAADGTGPAPFRLLVEVSRPVLEEISARFPPSDRPFPLAITRLFGGRRRFTFHFCNAATPAHPTAVNLILASDTDDAENRLILDDLENQTLSILGNHTGDRFEIVRISAVYRRVGTGSNRAITAACSLHLTPGPGVSCLNPAFFREIAALPNNRVQTAANSQRIEHWDKYLEINEDIARRAEVVAAYSRQRRLAGGLQMAFTVPGGEIGAAQNGSNIQLVTGETVEDGQTGYLGPQLGTIRACNAARGEVIVDLDAEFHSLLGDGRFTVPAAGRLFVSKLGDRVQLRRLRNGLKSFARGQAENRRLDRFIFDASQARLPDPAAERICLADSDLLQPGLNPEQRRAVEGVLNSPDLFLVQGPPGTGKTTVIAEICYQNAIRGQRTLIASQTNLAVDNALGKLVHHPKIRALRKGSEASVQAEGMLFVESRVIGTWLAQTAAAGDRKLETLAAAAARIKSASDQLPDIAWAYRDHRRLARWLHGVQPVIDELQRRNATLDQRYRQLDDAFDRFMNDPRGPAFNVLSAHATQFDTRTLVLIGRVNAAAGHHAAERRRVDEAAEQMQAIGRDLERLVRSASARLSKVSRQTGHDPAEAFQEAGYEFTLDDCVLQGEQLKRALKQLIRTTPGFLRILFRRVGPWTGDMAEAIAHANGLLAAWPRIARAERTQVEMIFDNPEMADAIHTLADTFRTLRESLLMTLNGNLSEIDRLLERIAQARRQQAEGRQRIEDFHESLQPYVAFEPFEQIAERAAAAAQPHAAGDPVPGDDDREMADWMPAAADSLETAVLDIYGQTLTAGLARLKAQQALVADWTMRIREPSAEDTAALKQLYIDNANVIGITCNQSGSRDFSEQYPAFDVAIIDEVSKATPPELILPLLKARKIVLVGDHKQLPPMVGMETYEEIARQLEIPETETGHMKTGLFEELFTQAPQPLRLMLSTQYRMHPQIMETINQFYAGDGEDGLRCGIEDPDERRRHGCHGPGVAAEDHALWVDLPQTERCRERRPGDSFSFANPAEVAVIRKILLRLSASLRANDPAATQKVGVISFYASQVRLLEAELLDEAFAAQVSNLTLRIGSVDRFQGIECPIVICSFVRNNERGDIGFARDPRRVNVALSRAQALSIIVGCSELFCDNNGGGEATDIYRTIAERIRAHGGFRNELDFA